MPILHIFLLIIMHYDALMAFVNYWTLCTLYFPPMYIRIELSSRLLCEFYMFSIHVNKLHFWILYMYAIVLCVFTQGLLKRVCASFVPKILCAYLCLLFHLYLDPLLLQRCFVFFLHFYFCLSFVRSLDVRDFMHYYWIMLFPSPYTI